MTPSVYISVEESSRELESKLLVAACLAERGINVVIGQQWLLMQNIRHLPPGLFFFKGNNGIQAINMRQAKRSGHLVASIEEENFGLTDEKEILRNYDREALKLCDLFFVAGSYQHEILANRHPEVASRIRVTGNPRFDFFRPELLSDIKNESARLRQKYGRFILCNFNYCGANSALGDALDFYDSCVKATLYQRNNLADDRAFRDLLTWEQDNLVAMMGVIRGLRMHVPDVPIIVRPHPAERAETWQEVFYGQPGITLASGGPHLPWTLASDVMIHTSCTTGMEAALAGHHAVSVCASSIPISDGHLSNLLNWRFDSPEEACSHVKELIAGDDGRPRSTDGVDDILDRHFAAGDGKLSAEKVAEALAAALPTPRGIAQQNWTVTPGFSAVGHHPAWAKQKMSAGQDDVISLLERLRGALSRFENILVTEIGASIFRLCT